ncbi:hypothetical protein EYF80_031349 [Liparis tanakae]|uniref:Uncharacterized protein n=1 Tax=Liparis tanakae TaxID=230148 RepID=A0A4Z2GXY1_9TELE|nr:hypothetical protein EYF80_031349 [Liparis tanakae]
MVTSCFHWLPSQRFMLSTPTNQSGLGIIFTIRDNYREPRGCMTNSVELCPMPLGMPAVRGPEQGILLGECLWAPVTCKDQDVGSRTLGRAVGPIEWSQRSSKIFEWLCKLSNLIADKSAGPCARQSLSSTAANPPELSDRRQGSTLNQRRFPTQDAPSYGATTPVPSPSPSQPHWGCGSTVKDALRAPVMV